MSQALEVVEVIRRSDQGVTRPFLCRASDDGLYFVKGRGAGKRSLICELLAGLLARRLDLPIAPFRVLAVSEPLVAALPRDFQQDLGRGNVFGSEVVEFAQEMSVTHLREIEQIEDDAALRIFGFDLWVNNGDRTLTRLGGNPNLLWSQVPPQLRMIDHNLAFDETFSRADFFAAHVFAERAIRMPDWVHRQTFVGQLASALASWDEFVSEVPDEWWYLDDERTLTTDFDPDKVLRMLERCRDPHFWESP